MAADAKLMTLRRDDVCAVCGVATPAGTTAWWENAAKRVVCTSCRPVDASAAPGPSTSPASLWAPPKPIDLGEAGVSAAKEHDRREAKRMAKIEDKYGAGLLGRVVKFMSDEPQSTAAWAKGSAGERKLGQRLNTDLADVGLVLHDRIVPKTSWNIDHIAVVPSGVWVIDAKNYTGKVEQRDVGGWRKVDMQLFVGGSNRMKAVDGMQWQVDTVKSALSTIGFADVPIQPALCFVDAEWGWFAKPFRVNGVIVLGPDGLIRESKRPGPLTPDVVDVIARHLSSALPASN